MPTAPAAPGHVAPLLGTLVALTVIGSSAVAVAIPVLAAELELSTAQSAWVLAAFSLTFSIATAVFGRLADLYGLRLPLRVGGTLFALGALLAALAPSFAVLVAARLVQGVGAGAVPVLVVGIIAARFEEEARSRALGGITAVVSVVSGSGPLIGGAVTQVLGWRAVLALPVLALLLTEPVARLAPAGGGRRGDLDVRGALLVALTVTGGALLLQSPATGAGTFAAVASGLVLLGGFAGLVRHVRLRPEGFLPRDVVANGPFVAGCLAGLTLLAAYLSLLFAVPAMLTAALGWSPLQVGLAMLPAAAFGAVMARVVGAVDTPSRRPRIVAGFAAGAAVGLLLAAIASGNPVIMVTGLALVAAGFAGGQVALIGGIPSLVAERHRNVALGVFNLLFFVGGTVGAAATGGLSALVALPVAVGIVAVLPAAGTILALRSRAP